MVKFFSIVTVFALLSIQTALTINCYTYSWIQGKHGNSSLANSINATAKLATGCVTCTKLAAIYKSNTTNYAMIQWMCIHRNDSINNYLMPLTAPAGTHCLESATAAGYTDGSKFTMACSCCSNKCNGVGSFCAAKRGLGECSQVNMPAMAFSLPKISLIAGKSGNVTVNNTSLNNSNANGKAKVSAQKGQATSTLMGSLNAQLTLIVMLFSLIML